jgi:ankyrin repeat protein
MSPPRHAARALTIGALCVSLAACTRGSAGDTELAFCDAVNRNDAAAAKAIFDAGQINMLARDLSGKCQPGAALLHRATPQYKEFTELAVTFAKREGIANTCWSTSRGQSVGGCAIQMVALNANPAVMRALVDSGVDVTNQIARGALSDAANQGSLEIVTMLVEKGADPRSAMAAAVSRRATAIVEYLESKGAVEDVPPLLVAARRGDLKTVDAALASRADLEVTDGQGRTPLIRAALYGHALVVSRLAKAGAKLDAVTPDDKHSALHIAANEGHVAVIQALAAARADMNIRAGADAPTPLLAAIANGKVESVRALIAAGADPNVWTESDTTAIRLAAVQGNLALTKALLAAGARVNDRHGAGWQPPILGVLEICGNAPEGNGENDYYRVTLMKALVQAGADGKAKNAAGETPVQVVSRRLAEADQPFYRACFQAKLDYLKTL